MPTIWTYLRAAAVVVGSSAALLTGGIAHADPVPAPPVPNIPQQLISSAANAPQILQNLATALGATPPAAPASPGITFPGMPSATSPASPSAAMPSIPGLTAPAAAAPAATPTIPGFGQIPGLAQAPAAPAVPAAPSIPGLPAIPGLSSPTAPAVPAAPQIPQAKVDMPAMPSGLPVNVNMPPQLTIPQDLQALVAGQAPAAAAAPAAPAAPAQLSPMSPLLSALP